MVYACVRVEESCRWKSKAGERLKIVAERSSHSSRCRWTAGERVSSRDTRDILVSEPSQSAAWSVSRRQFWSKNEQPSALDNLGTVSSQDALNEIYSAVRVITAHSL